MSDPLDPGKKHLFTQSNYLLDLDHLRGLESQGGSANAGMSMSDRGKHFLKEVPLALVDLDKALGKVDKKALIKTCARLKAECTEMGATYMIDLCRQLEKGLEAKDIVLSRTLSERLHDSFLVTRDQVLAYVSQFPKA